MDDLGDIIRQIADELGAESELGELTTAVAPVEEAEDETREDIIDSLTAEEWRRLRDLVTREWEQLERLKGDSERLHKLATNEALWRLKQMYDEHEDRYREIIVERWDRIAWLLSVPLEALQEIVVIAVPLLRILIPRVVEEVRIRIDMRPEQRDSADPDVIEELLEWMWTAVEWMVRVVRSLMEDFAARVVYTYPNWRDGVLDQVATDIIEHWGPEEV